MRVPTPGAVDVPARADGPSMTSESPSPGVSPTDWSTTGIPMALSFASAGLNRTRGDPEVTTPLGLLATAWAQAAAVDSAVSPALIRSTVQPTALAADTR